MTKAEYQIKYRATKSGKAAQLRYNNSEKGKAVHAKYCASKEAKAVKRCYDSTEKGKAVQKAGSIKWRTSIHGKVKTSHNSAKRRAVLDTLQVCDLTTEQWQTILEIHNFQCKYCGADGKLTMDHVTPISRGGQHTASNIVPACQPCNSRKGAKMLNT
jgi:5-methylcytosine-specific restriction endonuclease McrA